MLQAARQADGADGEFDDMLLERLDDVHSAFIRLGEEASGFLEQAFRDFDTNVARKIAGYGSYDALKAHAENDITYVWSWTVRRIVTFLEERVARIADHHESWLQEYLRPVVDAARFENPPQWYERRDFGILEIILATALCAAAVLTKDFWLVLPRLVLGITGTTFPIRYNRRFDAKRIIKGIRLNDMKHGSRLSGLDIERNWIGSENASFGGAAFGAAFGAILGPIGAIAGGAIGAVLGWLVGESLDQRKQKLYQSVVENVMRVLPSMIDELNRRLGEAESAMIQAIGENYKRNMRSLIALMKG